MIRPLTPADLDDCMRLKEAAGWNQTRADWETILRLSPDGCWAFEADGRAVASATAIDFGGDLAWIGMMLVLPAYRRRGIGRRLMEQALVWCKDRAVPTIKLDATDLGRPLYASLGFIDEEPIERWSRDPSPADPRPLPEPAPLPSGLDRRAFGCDRFPVVQALAASPGALVAVDGDGYALSRPGSNARFLGPVVGRSPAAAETVIRRLLESAPAEPWFWDLLPETTPAAPLAEKLGFRPLRRLTRMSFPAAKPLGDPALVWAAAGFEYG